jgi:hypothetical protein
VLHATGRHRHYRTVRSRAGTAQCDRLLGQVKSQLASGWVKQSQASPAAPQQLLIDAASRNHWLQLVSGRHRPTTVNMCSTYVLKGTQQPSQSHFCYVSDAVHSQPESRQTVFLFPTSV